MIVHATEAAGTAVRRVAASGRKDLVVVLGTGCCDSTAPYLYDGYYPGPDAVPVGNVEGVPIYAHRWLADLYGGLGALTLDCVVDSTGDSFSLESNLGCRLTLAVRTPGAGLSAAG
jgi:uncharacterized protein (DUF779 family)